MLFCIPVKAQNNTKDFSKKSENSADQQNIKLNLSKSPDSTPLNKKNNREDDTSLTERAIKIGKAGQYDRSLTLFSEILTLQKGRMARTYNNIGYLYELKGDTAKAIINYTKSIELNEKLAEPNANLGRIYFVNKNWEKAVKHGEMALKINPSHEEVKKWLPVAYDKLLEERKRKILGRSNPLQKKKNRAKSAKFQLNYQTKARTIYSYDEKAIFARDYKGYKYPYRAPQKLDLWFFPYNQWIIELKHETPDFGMRNPDFLHARQNLSLFYRIGNIHIGSGILLSQMNTEEIRDGERPLVYESPDTTISNSRNDSKFGFTFAHELRGTSYILQFFPRLYPRVDENTGGFTFDYAEYSAQIFKNMVGYQVYLNFLLREIYVFQFNVDQDETGEITAGSKTLSHYFGHMDFTIGADITLFSKEQGRSFDLLLILQLGSRLYFRDLRNEEPFKLLNGQGYFGFNPGNFLEGNLFKGAEKTTTLVNISFLEKIVPELSLREGVELEIANEGSGVYGFNLFFAADYNYF